GAANCANYYLDNDGDGYGVKSVKPKCLCSADFNTKHTSTSNTDCNDDNKKVYPSAKETCATPYDDDCDGGNNDINALGCKNFYTDVDGDNYGDKMIPPVCMCNPIFTKKLTATKSGDCADQSGAVNPGKQESCLTGYDDNCNGQTNDIGAIGCGNFYKDADKDGFGATGTKPVCLCIASAPLKLTALNGKDCDDGNKNINPNATEVCATAGVDDNCDGKKDPPGTKGCSSFYFDGDGDGYAQSNSTSVCQCGPNPATKFTAQKKGDCNDTSTSIKPGATEMCNGIDDDCDKVKDEGATSQCKSVSNASHACASGKCSITKCSSKYFDLDQAYSNGCECKADGYYGVNGNACTKPTTMGTFIDTSKTRKTISGNLIPGENDHWFYASAIDAKDVASCDNYDVRIKFTSNPGSKFQFDVYRGGCGGDKQLCKDETAHTYRTDFWGNAYGPGIKKAGKAGECKCTTAAKTLPGYNKCTSQSAGYYIRVHYKKGVAPTCSSFTLEFSNGYY
ncbi:MAG TPA: hypothetical protein DCQ06_12360, partial [Myxococcales bacterium]|nr:hypothetical protein [Myxococcales bacterium]